MAKLIALDWDQRQLRIVVANRHAKRTVIDEVHSIPIGDAPASPGTDQDEVGVIVKHLRDAISLGDGWSRGVEIRVAVRRADVELRLIQLPAVPLEELPNVVRFQAMREFSELSDDWPLDYLPLKADADGTTVLAAAIAPMRMRRYQAVVDNIDNQPTVMALRPTATATIVSELDPTSQRIVEVCVEDLGHAFEMSILRDGIPMLIRTVQIPQSEPFDRAGLLADEIRRTMLAVRDQLQGESIEQIVMFGSSQSERELGAELERQLSLSVRLLNPFDVLPTNSGLDLSQIENPGQFAAAIGMVAVNEDRESRIIDFLNPRRPPTPKSSRNLILAATTAGLLAIVLGVGAFYWHLQDLDRQVRNLQRDVQARRNVVSAAEERLQDLAAVQRWQQSHVNWLELLGDVSAQLPGPAQVRIDRCQADLLSDGNGQLILEGIVDRQTTIAMIDDALRGNSRRVVSAGGEFDNRNEDLPWRFKQTVMIETKPGMQPRPQRTRRP